MNGVEWVVSCVLPWAVSPHPNFAEPEVAPSRLLALVTEFRSRDQDLDVSDSRHEKALLHAAAKSLRASTQKEATEDLVALSRRRELTFGARAAAALYASVGLAEMDRHGEAIDVLTDVRELGATEDARASTSLIIGALNAQLALRYFELDAKDRVIELAHSNLRILRTDVSYDDQFDVSEGISWGAAGVLKDLRETLRARTMAAIARAEDFSGRSWTRVVRRRPTWGDVKVEFAASRRDQGVVRELFEQRIEAHSGKIVLGRSDAVLQNGYAALLQSQLGGDVSDSFRFAEELGKALAIRPELPDPDSAGETIRLFRQGRAEGSLSTYLRWLRAGGPLTALTDAAHGLIERRTSPNRLDALDLRILEEAGDLLEAESADRALAAVLERLGPTSNMSPAFVDRAWQAASSLYRPESTLHADVLQQVRTAILGGPPILPSAKRAVADVADRIPPEAVDDESRVELLMWANANLEGDHSDLASRLIARLAGTLPPRSKVGRTLVFGVLDDLTRATEDDKREAVAYLFEAIQGLREKAARGVTAYGDLDVLAAAAYLVREEPSANLQQAIVEAIADGAVVAALKANALRTLAYRFEPTAAQDDLLRRTRAEWSKPDADPFWQKTNIAGVFGEALLFSASRRYLSREEVIDTVMRLASSEDHAGARAAAGLAPRVSMYYGDPEWAQYLLLQLVQHRDPLVAAEAGRGLVELSRVRSSVQSLVRSRAIQQLQSDGVRCPLYALHGYQALSNDGELDLTLEEQEIVERLAMEHPSRTVRLAAAEVLEPRVQSDSH